MSPVYGLRTLARGALRPPENDSAFLLDVHRRAVPQERMARYDDSYSVDLVIIGAGAGGGTLAQRLARRGWKIVVLEKGPLFELARVMGTSVEMIERHYGTLLPGAAAGIASRLAAFEAEQDAVSVREPEN